MESYREEVDYMKKFCQKLDSNKTENSAFNDHIELFQDSTRKIKVNHDTLVDRATNIENFCDKYIPLISQNVVCDTLTQIVGSKERKKLELYEHKVYMKLHETLLKDEGTPDLEGHRDNLLTQINEKLNILTKIINERKFLVPKMKDTSKGLNDGLSITHSYAIKSKRSQSVKRVEFDDNTGQVSMKNYQMPVNPELEKEIQRAEEAERAIREMEANKGMLNYHRISEKELAEVGSIESSNIDYAEIFDERITDLENELEKTNKRINLTNEVVSKTDKTLRELTKRSVSEVQEYVYTLHKEVEELTERSKKEKTGITINEEVLKKLTKCK